jgi:hypothetical protein
MKSKIANNTGSVKANSTMIATISRFRSCDANTISSFINHPNTVGDFPLIFSDP